MVSSLVSWGELGHVVIVYLMWMFIASRQVVLSYVYPHLKLGELPSLLIVYNIRGSLTLSTA